MIDKPIPDQTKFSLEEPIFENQAVYYDEVTEEELLAKRKKKQKFIIIIAIMGILLIVLSLLLVRNGKGQIIPDEESPSIVVPTEMGPFHQRIKDARELLNLADPTKQDLNFPPIDLQIRLDPKTQ
jgi:flagellar basal body-associated protein FliL